MQVERAAYEPPHAPAGSQKGGQFTNAGGSQGEHSGSRPGDQPAASSGTSSTGTKPKGASKPTPKAPVKPVRGGPMGRGAKGKQVRQLQALLGALGIDPGGLDGAYGPKTEAAVKAAQKKLGLKPTGRADGALMKALSAAEALSPCIKRSRVEEIEYQLLRAQIDHGDFDEAEEDDVFRSGPLEWGYSLLRSFPLEDISANGRIVEAYTAIYDTPTEIHDKHGDYMEVVSRSAFDRMLSRWNSAQERPVVLYNHGMTMHGTPSDIYSVPIGTPLEIKSDGKGLHTVVRYNTGADADRVLDAINNDAIRGYSFRGRIYQSNPMRAPGRSRGKALPTVTRTELGLTDFGPTPTPYYAGAAITAVRSATEVAADLDQLDADVRFELIRRYAGPPLADSVEFATPNVGLGAGDSLDEHSRRLLIARAVASIELFKMGARRG